MRKNYNKENDILSGFVAIFNRLHVFDGVKNVVSFKYRLWTLLERIGYEL